jgi:enoyl-CoA hydratase/carnithine racemase
MSKPDPSLIVLSRPKPFLWLLTLASPPDNRLTPELLATLAAHLDTIEAEWRGAGGGESDPVKGKQSSAPGAVVLASGVARFFSNGLDLPRATRTYRFFEGQCFLRLRRCPPPTEAATNTDSMKAFLPQFLQFTIELPDDG